MIVDKSDVVAPRLLAWYDANARVLPWRSPPGAPSPDPYRVWLSEVMLQQTTVAAAAPYFARFVARWPDVHALAQADEAALMAAWAGLGYYARARNLLACARVVSAAGGRFPEDEAGLRALPGIGAYTAAAIAAIAHGRRAIVVDGNVERVVARLFAVAEPISRARPALRRLAATLTPERRAGDYAQAMMDLGATICTPRTPRCPACPIAATCDARAAGDPAAYPGKLPRAQKPVRHGTAFRVIDDGRLLLVRRPAKGLLGGMRALPTGPWTTEVPHLTGAPFAADWRAAGAPIRHVFTHFTLMMQVVDADPPSALQTDGEWWPVDALGDAGLPTLFALAAAA